MLPKKDDPARHRAVKYKLLQLLMQGFDENESAYNRAMISQLKREILRAVEELEAELEEYKEQLNKSQMQNKGLEFNKQTLEVNLQDTNRRLNEALQLRDEVKGWQGKWEGLQIQNHGLRLEKQALDIKFQETNRRLDDAQRKSLLQYLLLILATLLLSFGVNIVTSGSYVWSGWVMIALGVLLQVLAFFIAFSPKTNKN